MARGYVTIWPDSFSTRGFPEGVCTAPDGANVSSRLRANDAAAALAYLKTLPYVDGKRIAVMGGSHGGSATLAAIVDRGVGGAPSAGFAAAIALYPGCAWSYGDWSVEREAGTGGGRPIVAYKGVFKPLAPLLILTGALDDWTPAEPCRQLAERAKAAGHAVDIMIYPGAHHSFDSRNPVVFNAQRRNANAAGGRGATTGGNAEAWTAAVRDVEGFLGTWLGK